MKDTTDLIRRKNMFGHSSIFYQKEGIVFYLKKELFQRINMYLIGLLGLQTIMCKEKMPELIILGFKIVWTAMMRYRV